MQYLLSTLDRVPRSCVWEITDACNLRCVHCECSAGRAREGELTTAEALDLCEQLAELGTRKVSLSGGEPLVRRDWHVVARRLEDLGVEVNLITNGLLLDEAAVDLCTQTGVDCVSISIDGLPGTHDSIRLYPPGVRAASPFRRAYEALILARSREIAVTVVTHVCGRNIEELERMHDLLGVIPIDGWQLQLGSPQGRMLGTEAGYLIDPAQLPLVARFVRDHQEKPFPIVCTDDIGYYTAHESHLRRFDEDQIPYWVGCYAGIMGVAIESDGGVKGCPSLPSSLVDGNVRTRTLREIWQDPDSFPYNRKWDPQKLQGFCASCEFAKICRAGCTSFALASTGTIYENRHCLYRVERCGG